MVSAVSNSSVNTSGYPVGANSGHGVNSAAGPSVSGQGGGQISYDAYNSASKPSGNEKKLEEMDGMLNRLEELLGGKVAPDKKKIQDADGIDSLKDDKLDKAGKLDKADKLDKQRLLDKDDIDTQPEAQTSDNSLKSKALDILNKIAEVISRIFAKESPTSPAPSGSSAP